MEEDPHPLYEKDGIVKAALQLNKRHKMDHNVQ